MHWYNKFENCLILPVRVVGDSSGRFFAHSNNLTDKDVTHAGEASLGSSTVSSRAARTTDDDGSVKAIAEHVHDQECEKEVGSKREAMPPKSSQGLPAGSSLGTQPGEGEGAGQEKGGDAAESLQGAASRLDPHSNPTQTTSAAAKPHIQGLWKKVSISHFLCVDFPFKTLLPLSIRSVFGCAHKLCTTDAL